MAYQKLRGDHLFDGDRLWSDNKVLVVDSSGKKIDIINAGDAGEDVLFRPGLITPGFVNAHCHLELSYLKNQLPSHTTLVPFLLEVVSRREFPEEAIHLAIRQTLLELEEDGIVAVGDICNTTHTVTYKNSGTIQWRNFIEVLSMSESKAAERLSYFGSILKEFENHGTNRSALSPHAPYSISESSFRMINDATEGKTISIHNQETAAENELFQTGNGRFLELFAYFGIQSSPFPVTGTTSVRHWLPFFNRQQKIILVHNTFMPEEDIAWANEYGRENGLTLIYCFCPNANLFIEDRLPEAKKFIEQGCHIVLGTDSYSSNHQLKITEEILAIHTNFPDIPFETILRWATVNGSIALDTETRWISGSNLIERMKDR